MPTANMYELLEDARLEQKRQLVLGKLRTYEQRLKAVEKEINKRNLLSQMDCCDRLRNKDTGKCESYGAEFDICPMDNDKCGMWEKA